MRYLTFGLVALACLALLYLRAPDAFAHPDFWAEDGPVFWLGWRNTGLESLVTPYAGYLHLIPRTVAAATSLLPLRHAVDVFLAGAVLFTLWTSVTIFRSFPRPAAWLAAFAPLIAAGSQEVIATVTNLQWITAAGLAAIAISPLGRARASVAGDAVFATFAALSGPFSLFAAPSFAVRGIVAWRRGAMADAALSAFVLMCGALQAALLMQHGSGSTADGPTAPIWLAWRLFELSAGHALAPFVAAILLFGLIRGRYAVQRAGLAAFGLAVIAATVAKFNHEWLHFVSGEVGHRYFYLPSVMGLFMLATMLTEERMPQRIAAVAGLAALCWRVDPHQLSRPPLQHYGSWADAVESGAGTYTLPPGWTMPIVRD